VNCSHFAVLISIRPSVPRGYTRTDTNYDYSMQIGGKAGGENRLKVCKIKNPCFMGSYTGGSSCALLMTLHSEMYFS